MGRSARGGGQFVFDAGADSESLLGVGVAPRGVLGVALLSACLPDSGAALPRAALLDARRVFGGWARLPASGAALRLAALLDPRRAAGFVLPPEDSHPDSAIRPANKTPVRRNMKTV